MSLPSSSLKYSSYSLALLYLWIHSFLQVHPLLPGHKEVFLEILVVRAQTHTCFPHTTYSLWKIFMLIPKFTSILSLCHSTSSGHQES